MNKKKDKKKRKTTSTRNKNRRKTLKMSRVYNKTLNLPLKVGRASESDSV